MSPYTNWFKNPEYALRALDASYGGKMTNTQEAYHNTAIHIDIKCPLATDPTWSKLPKEIVSYLDKQFIGYFDKLLNILEPDIILVSINRDYIADNFRNAAGDPCSSKNGTTIKIDHTCRNGKVRQRGFCGWKLPRSFQRESLLQSLPVLSHGGILDNVKKLHSSQKDSTC